jgi:eukaryotic-like serine/threonine-protein kinase
VSRLSQDSRGIALRTAGRYTLALLMPLASGTKLGPYETQALLGSGGMGEVYRARDTRLGREVAIKVLAQHLSAQPELKERFDREARAISSLNHPRICTLHDVGHQNGVDFLVMEYLEGESLADRFRRGPLPLKETLKIGMEVCEALEVAHRAGITHRDLKPANIMLTRTGAKLMDFGLAKAAAGPDGGNTTGLLLSSAKTVDGGSPLSPLTTAGTVIGTIQYMSPEQIEGKPADQRSDLFALGAVLYEMATGKRPFDGKSQISLANAILEKTPEPISVIQPLTPPAFERVVSTCLEKNPDDRFQSARDVRLELSWVTDTAVPLAAQAARFSRDGQTIIYSGEWEGQPPQVAVARLGSPESRLLGIPSGTIASVSASDELAVFRGCDQVFLIDCGGTLATVSLAGGAPRDLAEHVAYADWNPDGKQLAIAVV